MNRLLGIALVLLPLLARAGGEVPLDSASIDVFDTASLQRGAKTYVQYCLGCHALKYMRFSRIASDLQMAEQKVTEELMYVGEKIHDSMHIAMRPEDAERWFGIPAPDLSVIARARGADWLFSYLRGFYVDESRPFGVNNRVFKDVAMPNVLGHLQGQQQAVLRPDGSIKQLKIVKQGELRPKQFNDRVTDLVNFLVYVGEPAQLKRLKLGKWVIGYLLIFWWIAYRLKKEYWNDIHESLEGTKR